jgi:fluoroacetyl-CoA thioesterase
MKNIFKPGDRKQLTYVVKEADVAVFQGEVVHPVCSTFSLAREVEWTTRQFVLDLRDEDEEGIGTSLSIDHVNPAFVGDELIIDATVESIHGHELICSYIARVGDRIVARGKTGQKILKRSKITALFNRT